MPEKKNQPREQLNQSAKAANAIIDQTTQSYAQAAQTGQKLQEEAMRWWTNLLMPACACTDWQQPLNTFANLTNRLLPLSQRRMEEMMELMEKNGRTTATLMQKAAEAAQTPDLLQSQAKWLEFWATSMGALRSNAEAFSELSTRAIDSWIDFFRQNTDIMDVRAPKTT